MSKVHHVQVSGIPKLDPKHFDPSKMSLYKVYQFKGDNVWKYDSDSDQGMKPVNVNIDQFMHRNKK